MPIMPVGKLNFGAPANAGQQPVNQTPSAKPPNFVMTEVPGTGLKDPDALAAITAAQEAAKKAGDIAAKQEITAGFENYLGSGKSAFDLTPAEILKLGATQTLDDAKQFKSYIDMFRPENKATEQQKAENAANAIQMLSKYAREISYSRGPSSYVTGAATSIKSALKLQPFKRRFDNIIEGVAPMIRQLVENNPKLTDQDIASTVKHIGDLSNPELYQRVLAANDLAEWMSGLVGKEVDFDPVGYNKLSKQQLLEIQKLIGQYND